MDSSPNADNTYETIFVSFSFVVLCVKGHSTADRKALKYSVEIAQLLVKQGCSPSATDSEGLTPVMYALQQVTISVAFIV